MLLKFIKFAQSEPCGVIETANELLRVGVMLIIEK